MSVSGEPGGHLAGVFANARELGRKVDTVEKEFQWSANVS
jgi:hypothetical protein